MRGILTVLRFGFRAEGVEVLAFPAERATAIGIIIRGPVSGASLGNIHDEGGLSLEAQ